MLDGASATIYISGHMGESSPSMEASRIQVQTSGMSAEYTRTSGGVFNFVMKSGTNAVSRQRNVPVAQRELRREYVRQNFYGRPASSTAATTGHSASAAGRHPEAEDLQGQVVLLRRVREVQRRVRRRRLSHGTVPIPELVTGNLSSYLTNQVLGTDALGRTVYRGADLRSGHDASRQRQLVRDHVPRQHHPARTASPPSLRTWPRFMQASMRYR